MKKYFYLIMNFLYYALVPLLISSVGIYSSSNNMTLICSCSSTCNAEWRGDNKCDAECNYASCHWDNGDCDPRGHYDGYCMGNASLINVDTKYEISAPCHQWAKMRRTCNDQDYLGLDLPWKVISYGCEWVMNTFIPRPSLVGQSCHSLIPCVSDKWCQEDCINQIKNFPQKCAWDPPKPIWLPTKYPTKRPTKRPIKRQTKRPTPYPTKFPTPWPTITPSIYPSSYPSFSPTLLPTAFPTKIPTALPTFIPSVSPSSSPSLQPTNKAVFPPHTHVDSPTQTIAHHTTNNSYGTHPAVTIIAIVIVGIIVIIGMCLYYKRQRYKAHMREINARRLENQANFASLGPTITIQDIPIVQGESVSKRRGIELSSKNFTRG